MAGHALLATLIGQIALAAFYTWLDRVIAPMEGWNRYAYAAGVVFALLAAATTLALLAGW